MSGLIQAIVLAAGASTRMKTKLSKLEQPLLGRPLIAWALDQAAWLAQEIIVVVGHQKEIIEKISTAFKPEGSQIFFAHQKEQKGTADAVKAAMPRLKPGAVAFIMGADTALLEAETAKKWYEDFEKSNAVLSFLSFRVQGAHAYGRVQRDSSGKPQRIIEAKDITQADLAINEVNAGFYLVQEDFLRSSLAQIQSLNKAGEFYLTDLVVLAYQSGASVRAYEISAEEALGANTLEELVLLEKVLQMRINRYWMKNGVRFMDPASTVVEGSVDLEANSILHAGVQLRGKTKVLGGAEIGAYSVIKDSQIGENARVESHCVLDSAILAAKASVGPFARLRPGADIGEEAHIGNFVEVKKSRLAKGVKAGHLSYLGDAEIGEGANIGAGTITCNYDGISKYRTTIAKDVFIGSNSSLVAPVEIGEGAIVGAGSVITESVEAHAIALTRSPQTQKKDAAKKFREKRKAEKAAKNN